MNAETQNYLMRSLEGAYSAGVALQHLFNAFYCSVENEVENNDPLCNLADEDAEPVDAEVVSRHIATLLEELTYLIGDINNFVTGDAGGMECMDTMEEDKRVINNIINVYKDTYNAEDIDVM